MSVSSLPEWKQLLLERKKREEEEKGRREREEEARLASMPAWKRGIILRRKAKQEGCSERERERGREEGTVEEGESLQQAIFTKSCIATETIQPVRQNPFICSQGGWRWGIREMGGAAGDEAGSEQGMVGQGGGGGEIRESRGVAEKESRERGGEREKGNGREANAPQNECRGEWEGPGGSGRGHLYPPLPQPLIPELRTIRAKNVIIIETDRGGCGLERDEEREGGGMDGEMEGQKRGMRRMDLREILAGGGSVTEIKASEVLIIKPPAAVERERGKEGGREGEKKEREGERGWTEPGGVGRVSQLLTKFGELPKLPCRSKSSEGFILTPRREGPAQRAELKGEGVAVCRGVPKRSFSFSDRRDNNDDDKEEKAGPVERRGCHGDDCGREGGTVCTNEEKEGVGLMEREELAVGGAEVGTGQGPEEGGFTVASRRNVEGLAFARKLLVRREARERGMLGKDGEAGWRTEGASARKADGGTDGTRAPTVPPNTQTDRTRAPAVSPNARTDSSTTAQIESPRNHREPFAGGADEQEGEGQVIPGQMGAGELSKHPPIVESEIQIPRIHFFREEPELGGERERRGRRGGEEGGLEVWRAGRPLTRVESLRRQIRQREREQEREKEREGREAECKIVQGEDEGRDRERRRVEAGEGEEEKEGMQEEGERGASLSLFRIAQKQEVAAPKPGPRLPVPAASTVAVASATAAAAADGGERRSESPLLPLLGVQGPAGEQVQGRAASGGPQEPVEEHREGGKEGDGGERDNNSFSAPSLSPTLSPSLSSSTPSPGEMSRIYSFPAAGCRGAASLSSRKAEPAGKRGQEEGEGLSGGPGVGPLKVGGATIQKQMELLHLRDQGGRKWVPQKTEEGSPKPVPQKSQGTSRPQLAALGSPQAPRSFSISPRAGSPSPAAIPDQGDPTVSPSPTATPLFSLRSSGGSQPDEIQVIGGYQRLDRSCLVKLGRKNKVMKVCFDEMCLERVCEYPSESAMLACFPCTAQSLAEREVLARGAEDEEEEEEEEEDRGAFAAGSARIKGSNARRILRVDESCRR
ncbi:hypothetical protein GJAV_G00105620 [Gymnothorax javanicus]|nr:hypothetical protein GJAV_G00105620 [Gymnothorax javanicus]